MVKKTRKQNTAARVILIVVLVILAAAGSIYFISVYFRVDTVKIKSNNRFESSYVESLAAIDPEQHMFFLDEEKIIANIEDGEPYLEVVSVTKEMPKTVIIEVLERQPKALVAYMGQYLLVDGATNVLEILDTPPEERYPVVNGIVATSVNLGHPVATEDVFKLTVLSELISALEGRDLFEYVYTVDLADINNILLKSYNGMLIKFGQADQITDKVKWIKNRLPALERDGKTAGVLDVSAGSFATYKLDETEIVPVETVSPLPADDDSGGVPEEGGEEGDEGQSGEEGTPEGGSEEGGEE